MRAQDLMVDGRNPELKSRGTVLLNIGMIVPFAYSITSFLYKDFLSDLLSIVGKEIRKLSSAL
jgi:hypothetical protein